jgi:carbonic anhydrase
VVKRYGMVWFVLSLLLATMTSASGQGMTGDQALEKLLKGNKRFAGARLRHPNQTAARRAELAKGQHPYAVIVSCSDSRVPPEVLFDQGIGDLFVVRVAGNTVDDVALGSVEYAVEHLHSPLVVVLGHERCGAVQATIQGGEAPGRIGSVMEPIRLAMEKAKGKPGDLAENVMRANAGMVAEQLRSSEPILGELVKHGKLKIVAARYDLDSGVVELLP